MFEPGCTYLLHPTQFLSLRESEERVNAGMKWQELQPAGRGGHIMSVLFGRRHYRLC
jgi:hypothetical protein